MIGITRALKITYVIWRYWLFTFLPKPKQGWPKLLFALIPRGSQASRGRRLRLSLEALGRYSLNSAKRYRPVATCCPRRRRRAQETARSGAALFRPHRKANYRRCARTKRDRGLCRVLRRATGERLGRPGACGQIGHRRGSGGQSRPPGHRSDHSQRFGPNAHPGQGTGGHQRRRTPTAPQRSSQRL